MSADQPTGGDAPPTAVAATNVTVRFGGITALSDVSIEARQGQIVGLVGPNGAGKSTLLAVLSGLQRPNAGHVALGGEDVTTRSPQERARRGLARTFQHPELFADLTVREHVVLAHRLRHARSRLVTDLLTARWLRAPDPAETEHVDRILELLGLDNVAQRLPLELPLGRSRLVEIARALATSPSAMLLDEPSSGLDRHETENLRQALTTVVADQPISLIMVEHDVDLVLGLANMVFVLDFGVCIASGTSSEIRANPAVRSAYLGDEIAREPDPNAIRSGDSA